MEVGRASAKICCSGAPSGRIGGPAWQPGTVAYLSGPVAGRAAACFAGSLLETVVLGPEIGKASALKMVYAAYSKGSTALLLATLAAAEALDVRADLQAHWASGDGELADRKSVV